jgi:hypothetical protein
MLQDYNGKTQSIFWNFKKVKQIVSVIFER